MLCGLREIGVLLKRQGLTSTQCVKMFGDKGVDGETSEHFISDVFKEYDRRGDYA